MRQFLRSISLALVLLLASATISGCRSSTEYGDCVGAFDTDERNPDLSYKVSKRNVILGALFFEFFFIPPAIVLAEETFCPVARKTHNQKTLTP